ncbi:uncharacterized protein SETTUDRAFT_18226 [Exserohilum turcica Et28A]|uniref:Xylanolytic transcriptional activator regulatory domain-containing protein n=1 Tax=Exserohilum turcicum (strain 28A) TaxID=671987 RepID=R0J3L6_EXST2|nr:uncharacterized protein SETTUDRAFT_18226 [Exserohilum turcica Et28A]EOA91545.1 hypothetical protein SETTUDRAFT_18226 [Exserohilum turcica Et28A]
MAALKGFEAAMLGVILQRKYGLQPVEASINTINRYGKGRRNHTPVATQSYIDRDFPAEALGLEKSTESLEQENAAAPLGLDSSAASPELGNSTDEVIHLAVEPLQHTQVFDLDPALSIDDSPSLTTSCATLEAEDTILQQVCQQIATPRADGRVGYLNNVQPWATVIEYQNSLQPTRILGELLACYKSLNRMTQIIHVTDSGFPPGVAPRSRQQLELFGLGENEVAFLNSANVFTVPSKDVCIELFEKFFTFAHPYSPVLDRCAFLSQYCNSDYSSFVMQAVLANAIPYASEDLLFRAGFATHQSALQEFNKRAILLYNFNCEKQQLSVLQGALLLGTQWITHSVDKDYRFWISTATRIAMRMGLHRSHIQDELDSKFYVLLKRIWGVLWVRDVLLVTTGLINERYIPDDCDTVELCEADWDEDTTIVPLEMRECLTPINITQKLFFIHLSRLARIGREAHKIAFSHFGQRPF